MVKVNHQKWLQSLIPWVSAAIIFVFLTSDAWAGDGSKPLGHINPYLRMTGELYGSYEAWDFFRPSPAINNDNSYDLWALRARLGALLTTSYVDGYAQAQYVGLYGLPNDAVASPGGPLGLGAAYFQANQSTNVSNIFLRQAHLDFKFSSLGVPGAFLKIGRFEFMDGMEYKTGNEKFDSLKRSRVAQRLLASNIVHVGRTFDGFAAVYDQAGFNMTMTATRPTQGGFTAEGQSQISDINLFYAAVTSKKDVLLPGTEGRIFYVNYDDKRNTQVVDNRAAADRPRLDSQNLNIHTVGAHLLTLHQLKGGSADALLWGAYQFGDWTNQKHQAWAIAAEAGYQWSAAAFKPWLRALYFVSSGDDDATDVKHKTFFSLLPNGRGYVKFPFYNLMNMQDAYIQLNLSPTPQTRVTIDLHHLSLTSSSDLFYKGLGPTMKSGAFGYSGQSSAGSSDVGQSLDISFTHTLTKALSWRFYYGHAFGGTVFRSIYQGKKDADMVYLDFNLVF
ncbi:alginate export family protein [Nitrosospira sp. Is2]|uniref:alginate export family protein n=1 Tax=Nitrosospira sp. Is2 TaxID=3080532 RepID=UPI002953BE2A|nr:alginate export family protein [Nitrosospira sp. Is2]WON74113.1 alginate export family protein [Nitrosospira sp. Is2]